MCVDGEAVCVCPGEPPVVRFDPRRGTVAAQSSVKIVALFCPVVEKHYTVDVPVAIGSTQQRLRIQGQGCGVRASLLLDDAEGNQKEVLSQQDHILDFGNVFAQKGSACRRQGRAVV